MTKSKEYQPRLYRESMGSERWISFQAQYLETDLWIAVSSGQFDRGIGAFTRERIISYRTFLDKHIARQPEFLTSLVPVEEFAVHPIIGDMYDASAAAGTGPMSAVAGAFAEHICCDLIAKYRFKEVVIENGGDIFMNIAKPATIAVYAGESSLSEKVGIIVTPEYSPLSICCSSATLGHSLSFGTADACVIACKSGALADAYATACCNAVKNADMVQHVTEEYMNKPGILSVVVIHGDRIGIGGKLEITVIS